MSKTCSTCHREILEGQGHYSTPHGLFCVACGLPFPWRSQPLQITVTGLDKPGSSKEANS